jgi:ubiquinone/menaquinone biosynthesis C-methylase UbiE
MTASEILTWTQALGAELEGSSRSHRRVLDLGSGTGRFSPSLANQCGADIIGVEPSPDMRRVAQRMNPHPHVNYIGGRAEAIPLAAQSCDAAFLFLSLHHFADLSEASREIARVVRPNGPILIRTEFSDRPHLTLWHGFVPKGGEIDRALCPAFSELATALRSADVAVEQVRLTPYLAARSLSAYIDRLHLLPLSALRILGKEETEAALGKLDLQESELSQPVNEVGHLLVCRRR